MDSNEEISDDIISYLLDSARDGRGNANEELLLLEGENEANVSTATDNDINYASELDTSLNLPSVATSSKKLEWDPSADVGCYQKQTEFKVPAANKLSTLERLALSNSASKLCLDEDADSMALIAKIDRVLAKSRHLAKPAKRITKMPYLWTSADSTSNASADTVIPRHEDKAVNTEVGEQRPTLHRQKKSLNQTPSPKTRRSLAGSEISSELFITRSAASVELNAANEPPASVPVTPTNFSAAGAEEEVEASSHCLCVSENYSDRSSCPTHTSLSLEHARRLQKEAMGELQVYRGLKEHLRNLKDYVAQLEETWKFLDQAKTSVAKSKKKSSRPQHRPQYRPRPSSPDLAEAPLTSSTSCSHYSKSPSLARSDRSFELERLNLNDTDSSESKPSRRGKSKCCAHCSLKKVDEPAIATPAVVPAQREPIAYDISVDRDRPARRRRPEDHPADEKTTRMSLQEALKERRPDFYEVSERRRQAIREISQAREAKVDFYEIPRLFTPHELRSRTQQLYRQLPEAQWTKKSKEQVRKEAVISNVIRATDFHKKLQRRVLHGQVNLPHTACL